MKTWKLVSGIISIVLFAFVMFQSCAVGISNSLEANGESGGSAGIIVAIMLLAGGIVSIATRNGSKGGNIALIVLCRFKYLGFLVFDLCGLCSYFFKERAMIIYFRNKRRKEFYICRIYQQII